MINLKKNLKEVLENKKLILLFRIPNKEISFEL